MRRLIATLVLAVMVAHFAIAQVNIRGTVKSNLGETLPGVNIYVENTNIGTITNIDGNYQINVPSKETILVFSFTGYKKTMIPVGDQTSISVTLETEIGMLDQLVVIGYQSTRKVNVSGAVDQIGTEELQSRAIHNLAQGLQGISPNLNIDFNGGEPGRAAKINIRGITSINEGSPLILIDNIPSDPEDINRISPEDVESISVLKDASSAAIYGARAAYGVILITTKTGKQEGINLYYTNNFSWDKPTVLPKKFTDPYIYLRLRETSTDNTPWDNQNYTDATYLWAKQRSENPSLEPVRISTVDPSLWEYMGDKDWNKHFLNDFTSSNKHHLAISGKSNLTTFYLSAGYDKQNGLLDVSSDYYERYSFRSKVNYDLYNWLTISNNTSYTITDRNRPFFLNSDGSSEYSLGIKDIYDLHPTDWDLNPDGSWANTDAGILSARLIDGGRASEKNNRLQSTFSTVMSLFQKSLKLNADYTIRKTDLQGRSHQNTYSIGYGPGDIRTQGVNAAYRKAGHLNYTVFNIYATFDKILAENHYITAIAGFNQEHNRFEFFSAEQNELISAALPTFALATGTKTLGDNVSEWAVRGAFYRLNYILKDKYILELNGRYDGSSKFPKDKRFAFFPSASAAWKVNKENFMLSLSDVLSEFKLRGSYGSLGNQFVDEYGYIASMRAETSSYLIGGRLPQQIGAPNLISPNYTWETVLSTNMGADIGLFANRISATFDYYVRNTLGMLTQGKDLPNVLGAAEPDENAADLQTTGWETSLNLRNRFFLVNKPLDINFRFILSDSRTKITAFDNPAKSLVQYYEGMELGEIWGLQNDGLFQTEQEIAALDQSYIVPWASLAIVPGWPKYKDLDGDHAITTGSTVDKPGDLSIIGNVTPRYRYAFNLNLQYANFDFSMFLQGVGKRDYYPLDYLYWGFYQQPYAGGATHLADFYRPTSDSEIQRDKHSQSYIDAGFADANHNAEYPILQSWLADRNLGERVDQAKGLAIPQTQYLQDASYLRLKNLTLGYTLPRILSSKIGVERIRIYASGENLTEWSKIKKYYDPESINDSSIKTDPAIQNTRIVGKGYAYPFMRRYSFGVNINF